MAVRLDSVAQGYGKRLVLREVTLDVAPGVTALVGPNGAGKTTLLKTLTTQMPPRQGVVILGNDKVDSARAAKRARTHIGYLPQGFGYDARFTVREHVAYVGWLRGLDIRPDDLRVRDALEGVGLSDRSRLRMKALSGGMRQRAGIAGALVGEPSLLVLDEPTVGLDPSQRLAFRDLIRGLTSRRVVLSTHLIEDVSALADRVVVLSDGNVTFSGARSDLEAQGSRVENQSLLESGYLKSIESTGERR